MLKPKKYDEVEVMQEFERLEIGGHKGVIMGVEEYTSPISSKTSLKVSVDTAKDDKQPEYFTNQYKNDNRADKKWSNGAIKYISLGEEETQVRQLKAFITAVENSNANFKFDWNKDISQLKGKKVGLVFGIEEYQNFEGDIKTATKLNSFRSLDKVNEAKIPRVKLFTGNDSNEYIDYEEYIETRKNNNRTSSVIENSQEIIIDDSQLPF